VLGRDETGYHELETVFLRLAIGDDVTLKLGGSARSIDCDESELPIKGLLGRPEKNLAFRAAELYREATGWPSGWAIEIRKRIPVGGGLGGGSADGGAVLRILNALAPTPIAEEQLMRIAVALGSDVPFLTGTAAMALGRGRGERLRPLRSLPVRDVAVGVFPFGVSTRDAYAWLASSRTGESLVSAEIPDDSFATWDRVATIASNDFDLLVGQAHPPIAEALAALRKSGARLALLSGSGSSVFGVFDQRVPLELGTDVSVVWTQTADSVVAVKRMG
jgi:4-diphosphocytidyl-2-C-methyl-D-erythritol kinase